MARGVDWRGPGWRLFEADPACGKPVRDWIVRIIDAHACPVDEQDAALVVSELFGSTAGLGYLIGNAGQRFDTPTVLFGVLLFSAFGVTMPSVSNCVESIARTSFTSEVRFVFASFCSARLSICHWPCSTR